MLDLKETTGRSFCQIIGDTLRCDHCLDGNDLTWPAAMASRLEKVAPEMLELRLLHGAAQASLLQRRISVAQHMPAEAAEVFGITIFTAQSCSVYC